MDGMTAAMQKSGVLPLPTPSMKRCGMRIYAGLCRSPQLCPPREEPHSNDSRSPGSARHAAAWHSIE